jgi:hypothetical protein
MKGFMVLVKESRDLAVTYKRWLISSIFVYVNLEFKFSP